MRLNRLHIKNYRCFEDEVFYFDDYCCLVGVNGSGKSTVLMALNVFFRNTGAPSDVINLQEEDFHLRNTDESVEITCTFNDLSDEAQEDLKAYVRQGELSVTAKAEWDQEASKAEVKQYGVRRVIKAFAPYFAAVENKAKAKELKEIYNNVRVEYDDLPHATSMAAMQDALRDYEENHPELCEEIESPNQFYGWSKGSNLLKRYFQWIYLPAVKDPTEEQDEQKNTALGNLLQRSIRSEVDFGGPLEELRQRTNDEYRRLLESQNEVLTDLAAGIQAQLRDWAHPGVKVELNWHFDDQKSVSVSDPFARAKVGEGEFLGEIVRAGHGLQRSFLVSMLRVLANSAEDTQPKLLLGFEEPELYQHPPQAKHLAALLEQLSESDNQIILTTHSPYFVSTKGYEHVRMIQSDSDARTSRASQVQYQALASCLGEALGQQPQQPTELMAAVEQVMQPAQTELFFCKVPLLVEGPEDVAVLTTWMHHRELWNDFRRLGCHFIPCNGKTNMSRPLAVANGLGMPAFAVFDGDRDRATDDSGDQQQRDNGCILHLMESEAPQLPDRNVFETNMVMWRTRILDEIQAEIGIAEWERYEQEARRTYALESGVRRKNPMLISGTLELICNNNQTVECIDRAANQIMKFARKQV